MNKQEQLLHKVINDNIDKFKQHSCALYLSGVLSGIVLVYSGVLSLSIGFISGVFITTYYNNFSILLSNQFTNGFEIINNYFKK